MSLSNDAILELLETMDPQEILTQKADQLDEAGRHFLAELNEDMLAGQDMFEEMGQNFREADDLAVKQSEQNPTPKIPVIWLRRGTRVPHWALAAAAILAGLAVLPSLLDWQYVSTTRGRTTDLSEVQAVNQELVEVLIKRSELLLDLGNQTQKETFYQEALTDLVQAYELNPTNTTLLSLLARIHEKLGHDKLAERFLQEWRTARAAQESL